MSVEMDLMMTREHFSVENCASWGYHDLFEYLLPLLANLRFAGENPCRDLTAALS
jgi:hypothetical protein